MSERPGGETAPAAWLVRGGELGEREEIALREGLVIAGWNELGDLSGCSSRESIRHALKLTYPEVADNVISNWTGQLWRFREQIAPGDLVVMPLHTRPGRVAIERVTGRYEYRPDEPVGFRQVRAVEWLRTDIRREDFRPDLRASTISLLTVCGITRNEASRRIASLAERGIDPGMEGGEEVTTAEELLEDAASRDPSDPRRLTVRSFLEHWGQTRRTSGVVAAIKSELADKGLTTRPPFTEGSLEDEIALILAATEPGTATIAAADTEDVSDQVSATLRVGSLPPAKLVSVPSSVSLMYARTLMLNRQFSQLAVIDDNGRLRGAVSWESISKAQIATDHPSLDDAISQAVVVDHDALLLEQIDLIYDKGFIFVQNADRSRITGIVTAADLRWKSVGSVSRLSPSSRPRARTFMPVSLVTMVTGRPEELDAVEKFRIHIGGAAAMARRVTKDLQGDSGHRLAVSLDLKIVLILFSKRLVNARHDHASSLLESLVLAMLLCFNLVEDRHGENEPHGIRAGKVSPRDLVV